MVQVRPPVSEGARVAEDLSEEVSIVGKPQRRMHAHGWQQSTRVYSPGTRYSPKFEVLPRTPTNQMRVLLVQALPTDQSNENITMY